MASIDSLARKDGLELNWRLVGSDWVLVNASMHANGFPIAFLQLRQDSGRDGTDVRVDLAKCMLIDPLPAGAVALGEHLDEVCARLSEGRSEPPPSFAVLEYVPRKSHVKELARGKRRKASP